MLKENGGFEYKISDEYSNMDGSKKMKTVATEKKAWNEETKKTLD